MSKEEIARKSRPHWEIKRAIVEAAHDPTNDAAGKVNLRYKVNIVLMDHLHYSDYQSWRSRPRWSLGSPKSTKRVSCSCTELLS